MMVAFRINPDSGASVGKSVPELIAGSGIFNDPLKSMLYENTFFVRNAIIRIAASDSFW